MGGCAVRGWINLCAVLSIAGAGFAHAQGTITDGAVSYSINSSHFDGSPSVDLRGVSTPAASDQLFESGWWYRVAGDTFETPFPAPSSQIYAGSEATLTWNDVDGRGFSAQQTIEVVDVGGPSGRLTDTVAITNLNLTPLAIDLFQMTDMEISSPNNDFATLLNANDAIFVLDGLDSAEYVGLGASAFLVRPFDNGTDVAAQLSNGTLTNFDNSGLPAGPGDVTAGFQWATVTLAPGETRAFTMAFGVNTPAATSTTSTTATTTTSSTSTSTTTLPTTTSTTTLPTTTSTTTSSTSTSTTTS